MGLFGGGNSSNTTLATTNNFDQRSILTNTLDGGAIEGAFDFASQVSGGALSLAGGALASNSALASQSIGASGAASARAYDYADNLFGGALGFARQNASGTASAYDHAAQSQEDAFSGALGFMKSSATAAQSAFDKASGHEAQALGVVQSAYADAKGTTQAQQKMILAVLALAGVALLVMRGK